MAEVNPPGFLQNAGNVHTAEILRAAYSGLTHGSRSSGSLVPRGGVVNGLAGNMTVVQNGSPNMSVNVNSGQVYVPGTEGTKQGTYVCTNDASKNVTIAAADGTNPRIDLVVAKVQDTMYSGAVNSWSIVAVTGTPAGSPAAPTAPANSVVLAQILVGAGVSSIVSANITDRRFFAAGLGGRIRCTATTRPDPTTVPDGTEVYEQDTGLIRTLIGTTWSLSRPYRQTTTTGADTASITFSNIPTTLRRLELRYTARGNAGADGTVILRVNGNSGTNYHYQFFNSFNVGSTNTASINQTSALIAGMPTGGGAGPWGVGRIDIVGWDAPHATYLTGTAHGGYVYNITGGSNNTYSVFNYTGSSASGYTSLTLTQAVGSFIAGSEFILEGWD